MSKCDYCNGTSYDPYDEDPMGRSMNTPCYKCKGTGLSERGQQELKDSFFIKSVEDARERNR